MLDQTFIGNAKEMDLWPRNALTGDWNAPKPREPVPDVATRDSEPNQHSIFAGHDLVDLHVDIGERLRAPLRNNGPDGWSDLAADMVEEVGGNDLHHFTCRSVWVRHPVDVATNQRFSD